jgi:hypothetical protein
MQKAGDDLTQRDLELEAEIAIRDGDCVELRRIALELHRITKLPIEHSDEGWEPVIALLRRMTKATNLIWDEVTRIAVLNVTNRFADTLWRASGPQVPVEVERFLLATVCGPPGVMTGTLLTLEGMVFRRSGSREFWDRMCGSLYGLLGWVDEEDRERFEQVRAHAATMRQGEKAE